MQWQLLPFENQEKLVETSISRLTTVLDVKFATLPKERRWLKFLEPVRYERQTGVVLPRAEQSYYGLQPEVRVDLVSGRQISVSMRRSCMKKVTLPTIGLLFPEIMPADVWPAKFRDLGAYLQATIALQDRLNLEERDGLISLYLEHERRDR